MGFLTFRGVEDFARGIGTIRIDQPPCFLACCFRPLSSVPFNTLIWIGDDRVADSFVTLRLAGDAPSTNVNGGGVATCPIRCEVDGSWYVALTVLHANDRRQTLAGRLGSSWVQSAESIVARTPGRANAIVLGRRDGPAPSNHGHCDIAWAAVGTGAPAMAQVRELIAGRSPLDVVAADLRHLYPMLGGPDELDLLGGIDLKVRGALHRRAGPSVLRRYPASAEAEDPATVLTTRYSVGRSSIELRRAGPADGGQLARVGVDEAGSLMSLEIDEGGASGGILVGTFPVGAEDLQIATEVEAAAASPPAGDVDRDRIVPTIAEAYERAARRLMPRLLPRDQQVRPGVRRGEATELSLAGHVQDVAGEGWEITAADAAGGGALVRFKDGSITVSDVAQPAGTQLTVELTIRAAVPDPVCLPVEVRLELDVVDAGQDPVLPAPPPAPPAPGPDPAAGGDHAGPGGEPDDADSFKAYAGRGFGCDQTVINPGNEALKTFRRAIGRRLQASGLVKALVFEIATSQSPTETKSLGCGTMTLRWWACRGRPRTPSDGGVLPACPGAVIASGTLVVNLGDNHPIKATNGDRRRWRRVDFPAARFSAGDYIFIVLANAEPEPLAKFCSVNGPALFSGVHRRSFPPYGGNPPRRQSPFDGDSARLLLSERPRAETWQRAERYVYALGVVYETVGGEVLIGDPYREFGMASQAVIGGAAMLRQRWRHTDSHPSIGKVWVWGYWPAAAGPPKAALAVTVTEQGGAGLDGWTRSASIPACHDRDGADHSATTLKCWSEGVDQTYAWWSMASFDPPLRFTKGRVYEVRLSSRETTLPRCYKTNPVRAGVRINTWENNDDMPMDTGKLWREDPETVGAMSYGEFSPDNGATWSCFRMAYQEAGFQAKDMMLPVWFEV